MDGNLPKDKGRLPLGTSAKQIRSSVHKRCLTVQTHYPDIAAVLAVCEVIRLGKAAIRRRHPEFSEEEIGIKFIELNYGQKLAESVRAWRAGVGDGTARTISRPALSPVVHALRSLNIRHYIGGIVASSFHGATRSTIDVDVVAEILGSAAESVGFGELLTRLLAEMK